MIENNVRMQCQAQTDNGSRCSRRGRLHLGEESWFCWQHSACFLRWEADYRGVAVYPPCLMGV
jgi:hypothetical protein